MHATLANPTTAAWQQTKKENNKPGQSLQRVQSPLSSVAVVGFVDDAHQLLIKLLTCHGKGRSKRARACEQTSSHRHAIRMDPGCCSTCQESAPQNWELVIDVPRPRSKTPTPATPPEDRAWSSLLSTFYASFLLRSQWLQDSTPAAPAVDRSPKDCDDTSAHVCSCTP